MLETHEARHEFIFDLRVQFFIPKNYPLEEVQSKFSFYTDGLPDHPLYLPETITLDFDSDWAEDKPGFLVPISDMAGESFWPAYREVDGYFPETADECSGRDDLEEWFYFCRVLIEVDSKYDWDFSDEEGMEEFDEKIKYPFFDALRLNFKDLKVTSYNLGFYDTF
jgi:hypothetical protein